MLAETAGYEIHQCAMKGQLGALARTDELTGLFNRRAVMESLRWQLAHSLRSGLPLTVMSLDLDHFKRINDTHGHPAGDEVLKRFATLASQCLRRSDVLARYGGEEFVVLFPQSDHVDCEAAMTRLKEQFAEQRYPFDPSLRVTLSCGLAGHHWGESASAFI